MRGKGSWPNHASKSSAGADDCLDGFTDEEGVTIVLAPGDEYREIAQNDLGEMTLASPAVAGNALFIRTAQKLYRIQQ